MEMLVIRAMLLREKVRQVLSSEKGQGMVEYGLILALIAVVAAVGFTSMGTSLKQALTDLAGKITGTIAAS